MVNVEIENRWIVEASGTPLGLVVQGDTGFVFHAAAREVWALNGTVFRSADAAMRAAQKLFRSNRRHNGPG